MTAEGDSASVTLESLYRERREPLYRALVLITGNRDLATEAIDRGFRGWHQIPGRGRDAEASLMVLRHALRWVRRRLGKDTGDIRGFALPAATPEAPLTSALAELPLSDRILLVATHYLRYDEVDTAMLTGIDAGSVPLHLASLETALGTDAATITATLEREAASYHQPLSRLESVRAQSIGRRVGALVGAAALTLGAVGGGVALLSGGEEPPSVEVAASGRDPATGVATTVALGETPITWTQVALPAGGEGALVTHGSNGFVLIDQDYSGPQPTYRVLQSTDGATWEVIGDLPTGPNSWIQQLQTIDDRYVVVGSGFDERNGREQPAVWISEDGAEWTRSDLPVDDKTEIAGQTIQLHTYVTSLSSTTSGIALVGGQGAEMDMQPLLEDALPEDVNIRSGWGFSPTSLEIYGNEGRVVQRIPWDELDVDPELIRLMTGGRSVLWTSEDGEEWSSRVLDIGSAMGGIGSVALTGGAGAALVWQQFGASVWAGALDGTWERTTLPGLGSASAVAALGDDLVIVGQSADGGSGAWTSTDGATWLRVEDPDVTGNLHTAISSGAALLVMGDATQQGLVGPAIVDLPEGTLEITSAGTYTLTAADGATLFSGTTEDIEYDGPDVLLVDDEGTAIAVVSQLEIEQAWENEFRSFEFEGPRPPGAADRFLVITTDAQDWRRIDLAEVAPAFYPAAGATDGKTIVLTGHQEGPGLGGPGGIAWVGTTES